MPLYAGAHCYLAGKKTPASATVAHVFRWPKYCVCGHVKLALVEFLPPQGAKKKGEEEV